MSFPEGTPTETITLGGKEYTVAWTWGAKRRVMERCGSLRFDVKSEEQLLERLPIMLWASMTAEDRETLSVDDVADMIHVGNEEGVMGRFGDLLKESEPEVTEGNGQPAPVKKPRAGKKST